MKFNLIYEKPVSFWEELARQIPIVIKSLTSFLALGIGIAIIVIGVVTFFGYIKKRI